MLCLGFILQLIRLNQNVSADSLDSVAMSQLILSAGSLPATLVPVIEGHLTLNNCKDVHIGHKYENSGDVVIHQKISVVGEAKSLECLSDHCRQIVVSRDVVEPNYSALPHKTGMSFLIVEYITLSLRFSINPLVLEQNVNSAMLSCVM